LQYLLPAFYEKSCVYFNLHVFDFCVISDNFIECKSTKRILNVNTFLKKIICNHTLTLQTHVFAAPILSSAPSCVTHLCESFAGYCRHSHRCVLYYIACAEIRLVEEHAKLVFANILAVVNLFRNTVNNVRKLSTSPVRRVTTASGKSKKTVNQYQEKTQISLTLHLLQCYSSIQPKSVIRV
jgi:hypothetical protein